MQKFPITKEGYSKIVEELKEFKTIERPQIIKAIAAAREQGDLSENADYQAARERQSFIEGKILELEDKIARSEVIDISTLSGNTIKFGAKITVLDCDTEKKYMYKIVGEYEANLEKGLLSITSPIVKALIGKSKGDFVEVNTPSGFKEYEVLSVEFK